MAEAATHPGAARRTRAAPIFAQGYDGARVSSQALKEWLVGAGSADADTLRDLPQLRAYSRDLERNAPLAGGAIHTSVTNIVGTGLAPQPRINRALLGLSPEAAEAWEARVEWLFWEAANALDITRQQDFGGLQDLVMRSTLSSGDVFTLRRHLKRAGDLLGLKLQIVEADRVSNPRGVSETSRLRAGVELDEYGAPVAYHVANRHPGETLFFDGAVEWSRLPAFGRTGERQTLHHYRRLRPGQTRGVPYLAPVIGTLKQLDRYSEAEIMAAVVSAFFTVFVKTEDGQTGLSPIAAEDGTPGEDSESEYKLGPGAILDLQPNEDITVAQMNRPNSAFDGFVLAVLRQVAVGLELPFEVLIKHFTSSYSAARAALLDAWKFYRGRRAWLVWTFCQPVYEMVVSELVAAGYVDAPGFFRDPLIRRAYLDCQWIGDSPGQIDPKKEADASTILIDNSLSTVAEETSKLTGGDWRRNIEQRKREMELLRAAGLQSAPAAKPDAAPGEPDATDANDRTQEE